jgi:ATP-binding cassette subfamily C protein CydCD
MSRGIRNSPFAGLDAIDRRTLYLLGLLSALKAFTLIGMATAVTTGVVDAIAGRLDWWAVLPLGIGSALVRGAVSWMHRVVAARAAIGVKERLRAGLADHVLGSGGSQGGSVATLATQGLDELDKYYTNYLPALVTAITVPAIIGVRILFADWVSALIVVITVPLIPVFMTLIGLHTREKVEEASSALGRLSDHLVELARGLPVLIGLGRAKEQVAALEGISERYRAKTVETLRIAFLSSLALELIATISVAVVAVFIGVRLVAGDLTLEVGLLVLILAPECMAPFRDIGSAFHAAQDGRVALSAARDIIGTPAETSVLSDDAGSAAGSGSAGGVRVQGLTVRFADRDRDTLHDLDLFARSGRITLLDGRSGAGKSTVLAVLAGRLRSNSGLAHAGSATVTGSVAGIEPSRVAWLPQHPRTVADTVLDELLVYAGDSAQARNVAGATLDRLGLAHLAAANPASISPGELRRLAMARVLLRVDDGADVVLLDEPTAQLDAESARIVVDEIMALRLLATVIVASHDEAVRAIADTSIELGASSRGVAPLRPEVTVEEQKPTARTDNVVPTGSARAALIGFLSPVKGRIIASIALGTGAAVFAVCLTALSGWLIVRASEHPPIMYLLVAIVGVRFFGIGRAVLRYFERLIAHDAVFAAMTSLRSRLWSTLAGTGIRDRSVLGSGATLDRLVRDVDQMRDLTLRVVVPLCSGFLAVAITVAGMWILAPSSAPVMLVLAVIALVAAPAIAVLADRSAVRRQQQQKSLLLRRFSAIMSAAGDLRGNGVDGPLRDELARLDSQAGRTSRRSAWALGLGGSLLVAACGCAAVVAIFSAAAGGVAPGVIAVMALVPLALIDPLLDYVAAAQLIPALREVLARSGATVPANQKSVSTKSPFPATSVDSIEFDGLAARWLDSGHPVIDGVSGRVERGDWLVVSGPSGSGKSTLLSVLLGHLDPLAGSYRINGRDTAGFDLAPISAQIGWCPQEGHLFDSTLRANLLIARGRDEAPDDAELESVIRLVGLGPLLDRLPLGLDTTIGPDAARLSGGERQRVAVARTLLTRADVILLDEPTAHLDDESAESLMADLRVALSDRIAVLVTHHAVGLSDSDARVRLGGANSADPAGVVLPTAQSGAGVGAAA